MWLSSSDTYNWATRPGNSWPCSIVSGNRLMVVVDSNGLSDLTVNGRDGADIDGNELEAIVADHLPPDLRVFWPCWEQVEGERQHAMYNRFPLP